MSDDLVNRITLDYLISKQQLQKLNKHIKQKETDTLKTDKDIYRGQISELFTKLMNDEIPDNLLQEVKNSFSYFTEKSIYYLKLQEQEIKTLTQEHSKEHSKEHSLNEDEALDEALDEDLSEEVEETEEEEEEEEEEVEEVEEEEQSKTQKVFRKKHNQSHSDGVENIQRLPLDWFTTMRHNYKQNQIQGKKNNTVTPSNNKK
jgi:hypothetical protein